MVIKVGYLVASSDTINNQLIDNYWAQFLLDVGSGNPGM